MDDIISFKKTKIILLQFIILVCILMLSFELLVREGKFSFYDFEGQWQLVAYALQGIDPYPLIGTDYAPVISIGAIPKGWGTVPWGLTLGNIFYAGFLSLHSAIQYSIVFNFLLLCLATFCVYDRLKYISDRFAFYSSCCVFLSHPYFFGFLQAGNAGSAVCCFLLLSALYCEDHPEIAGFLLGVAMIKPQVALIVLITFLFLKQYRVVTVALLVVVVFFLATSFMVWQNPLVLLYEFFRAGIGSGHNFSGIFSYFFIGEATTAMYLSMFFGILVTYLVVQMIPNSSNSLFRLFPAFLVANFWCYSFFTEFYILLVPLIICLYSILYAERILVILVSFLNALYLLFGFFALLYFPSIFYELPRLLTFFGQPVPGSFFVRSIYSLGLAILLFTQTFALLTINNSNCLDQKI